MIHNNDSILRCTFCEKSQDDVDKMIASSPTVAICNHCIEMLSLLIKDYSNLQSLDQYQVLQNEAVASPDERFWLWRRIRDSNTNYIRCLFCHKRQVDVDRMIGKTPHYVCEECISAMVNLLAEEENCTDRNP
jgi:ATP-dependent protease Clp ATPase subunit